ncbi:hypothetical protein HBI24_206830 [Parastagonospora nodorum]|nr:hypothetical protein HBI24_206830 [Parastagonospora nodorum]KAH5982787.1 hypothetical protein HBI82_238120 [Parastagonospora nodorum]
MPPQDPRAAVHQVEEDEFTVVVNTFVDVASAAESTPDDVKAAFVQAKQDFHAIRPDSKKALESASSSFWQAAALWGTHQHYKQSWEDFATVHEAPSIVRDVLSTKVRDLEACTRPLRAIIAIQSAWGADWYRRLRLVAPFPIAPKHTFLEQIAKLSRNETLSAVERLFPASLQLRVAHHLHSASFEESINNGTRAVTVKDLERFIARGMTSIGTSLNYREPSRRGRPARDTPRPRTPLRRIVSPEQPRYASPLSLAEPACSDADAGWESEDPGLDSPLSRISNRSSPSLDVSVLDSISQQGSLTDDNASETSMINDPPVPETKSTQDPESKTSRSKQATAIPSPQILNANPTFSGTKTTLSGSGSPLAGHIADVVDRRQNGTMAASEFNGGAPRKRQRRAESPHAASGDLAPGAQLHSGTLDTLLRRLTSGQHPHDYVFYDVGHLDVSWRPAAISAAKFAKARNVLVRLCLHRHWILLRFDLRNVTVHLYDSMRHHIPISDRRRAIAVIGTAIWDAADSEHTVEHWAPPIEVSVPQQQNNYDCGIWVIITTMRIIHGHDVDTAQNTQLWRLLLQALESEDGRSQALAHLSKLLEDSSQRALTRLTEDVKTIRTLIQQALASAQTRQQQANSRADHLAAAVESNRTMLRRQHGLLRKVSRKVQDLDEHSMALDGAWQQQHTQMRNELASIQENVDTLQLFQEILTEFTQLVKQHGAADGHDQSQSVEGLERKRTALQDTITEAVKGLGHISVKMAKLNKNGS